MPKDSGLFTWLKIQDLGAVSWPAWPDQSVNNRVINDMPGVDIEQVTNAGN